MNTDKKEKLKDLVGIGYPWQECFFNPPLRVRCFAVPIVRRPSVPVQDERDEGKGITPYPPMPFPVVWDEESLVASEWANPLMSADFNLANANVEDAK